MNRRRRKRHDEPVLNAEQRPAQASENRSQPVLVALPLVERLEHREDQSLVRRAAGEAEAHDREDAFHFRRRHQYGFSFLRDIRGVPERRARRCLHERDEIPGIFRGEERLGHPAVDDVQSAEQRDEDHDHRPPHAHQPPDDADVQVGSAVNRPLDAAEETSLSQVVVPKKQRRQRGRQGQRVEGGDGDRERDRQRELLIEAAGRAREERHRHEHRDEHQRRGDDGAEHFAHRVGRRLLRALLEFLHVPLDVLYHHDRIVDDDAGGQDDRKQRQRVDREAEEVHERKRADQRYGHRQRRDDGRAPALKEEEHHEHDEGNRLGERLEHFPDRFLHDGGRVEGDRIFQARRERLRQALELGEHAGVDVERVGRRQRDHADAHRIASLEAQHGRIVFRAELHPADIRHAHERPVGARLDDDAVEFRSLVEAAGGPDAELIRLPFRRGRIADAARGHVQVLLTQRIDNVARRELPRGKPHRVEPDAHRVLALAEDDDVGHARHALDRVLHVDVEVVRKEQRIVLALLRIGARREHEIRRGLLDRDAKLADLRRQPAERLVDLVLHVDRRQVVVAGDVEGDRDGADAGVAARGGHVEHPLDAVDRLFERRGDGGLNGLGVGARIDGDHLHGGRRHGRVLRDWHRGDRQRAGEDDDEGADGREDRPRDERVNKHNDL